MIRVEYTNGKGIATGGSTIGATAWSNSIEETFNTTKQPNFLSTDGYGFDLSGTKSFAKSGDYIGIASILTSDGALGTDFQIDIEGDFSDVRTSSGGTGLTIYFYKNKVTHCRISFWVGNVSALSYTYDGEATNRIYMRPDDVSGYTGSVDKIRINNIILENATVVGTQARVYITNIAKGNVEAGNFDDIQSHSIIDEINILSTDLPICQFEAVVAHSSKPITDGKISVYSNDRYINTYWIDNVEQVAKKLTYVEDGETKYLGEDLYSIVANNAIALLDRAEYRGWRTALYLYKTSVDGRYDYSTVWLGTRLEEFINEVQDKYGVSIDISNPSDYGIYGYVDHKSYRHNLCAVAYALGKMIKALDGTNIELVDIPTTIKKVYVEDDPENEVEGNILGQASITEKPTITSVEYHRYLEGAADEIDISDDTPENEGGAWLRLKNSTITSQQTINYSLATIVANSFGNKSSSSLPHSADAYADKMKYWITGRNPQCAKAPFHTSSTVTTSTITKSSEEVIDKYDYFTVSGVRAREDVNDAYAGVIYLSHYQDAFVGTEINRLNDFKKFSKSKGTINATVILDDERVGDKVTVKTFFGDTYTGIITKMNIHCGYPYDTADIEVTEWA